VWIPSPHLVLEYGSYVISQWDQAKIVKFGWSADERLVVLNEEGVYRLYDLQGEYTQFSIGAEASELGIIDAKIYDGGMVVMTGSLLFLEVKGWEGAKPLTLSNPSELLFPLFHPSHKI
jgi:hypothetical protein